MYQPKKINIGDRVTLKKKSSLWRKSIRDYKSRDGFSNEMSDLSKGNMD
ncbi:hypothetical protein [Filifactor alocis]|nr:hypothetical protein [Filifactor alocis]